MDQSSDDRTETNTAESVDGRTAAGAQRPHDAHGRFVHVDIPGVSVHKTSDDNTLVDVHVNNPLHKIVSILEDIKKQKAFSFSLKGSLGVAGIVLVLTTFGIFGGTRAFCSKGTQSHIGKVQILAMEEDRTEPALVERVANAWNALVNQTPSPAASPSHRVVLIEVDSTVYHLLGASTEALKGVEGNQVIVTGDVDACGQTIKVNDPAAVQLYSE